MSIADFTPEPNSGCWIFLGYIQPFGHGWMWDEIEGRPDLAHRISWRRAKGPIPDGLCVLHWCDVPCCINPAHLFLGTHLDNSADMIAKGRAPDRSGEMNGRAKLNADDVRLIRNDPRSQSTIAAAFGVKQPLISRIKSGHLWSELQ